MAIAGLGATGVYLGYQHAKIGGIRDRFSNFFIEQNVKILWRESGIDEPFLDVIAIHHIPVIVGAATNKENLEKAKALAFMKSDNVQCIADDILLGNWNYDLAFAVKAKLFFNFHIASRNYYIMAMRKQVFIVGIATDNNEKAAIIDAVSSMNDVEKCVHYIIVDTIIDNDVSKKNGYVIHND